MNSPDCIFCKIITKEIPASIIYEDENFFVFLDINPVRKGHLLLIPRSHYPWMQDVPDELLAKIFIVAKKIMIAMKKSLSADYVQVSVEGKDIPHFHIHLIPRDLDDGLHGWATSTYQENEAPNIADKIKNAL